MKIALSIAMLSSALLYGAGPAAAEVEYPWCIITAGESDGVMSCGYVSYAQCMQTRVGTEMCVQNPHYRGPAPSERPGPRRPSR